MLEPLNRRLKVKAIGVWAEVKADIRPIDQCVLAKAVNTYPYIVMSGSAPRLLCNKIVEFWCLLAQREVVKQLVDAICKDIKDA